MLTGGCHCGAVRYEVTGEAITHALCHCSDCRRHAGAPMVAWTMYPAAQVQIVRGETKIYVSSPGVERHFCADCGTGLLYINETNLPGIVDVQSGTYDDPDAVPAQVHIQVAERVGWMALSHTLPEFERFPGEPAT